MPRREGKSTARRAPLALPTEAALTELAFMAGEREPRSRTVPAADASLPPEAYQYEAELKQEIVKSIQRRADKTLSKEDWIVIDGVDKG